MFVLRLVAFLPAALAFSLLNPLPQPRSALGPLGKIEWIPFVQIDHPFLMSFAALSLRSGRALANGGLLGLSAQATTTHNTAKSKAIMAEAKVI